MNIVTGDYGIAGEYQLTNGLGPDKARQVMNDHRNSFITESDFAFMSSMGINAVRIPVGWWIASDPNPPAPFIGGSLKTLDNAFTWAKNHKIGVIVDLHAVPGSQNGDAHSSTRDGYPEWPDSQDNIDKSIAVIDFLAGRYASNSALLGFELLNEPLAPGVPLNTLKKYYIRGYDTVRKHSSSAYVIMCNRIGPADAKELFDINNGLAKTVVDVHYYNLYDDSTFKSMSVQQNINYITNNRAQSLRSLTGANGTLIYVGLCGFLGRCHTDNTASKFGGYRCDTRKGEWTAEWDYQDGSMSDYQRFSKAQLQVYGTATFGWGYWTLKNVQNHWSFEWMVKNNYLQL